MQHPELSPCDMLDFSWHLFDTNTTEELYRSLKVQPYEQDTSKTYAEVLLDDFRRLACSGAISPEHEAEVERIKAVLRE